MNSGIVGYQGSGKSTLFHWLTGEAPDPALAHATQHAMAPVPDERIDPLVEIYQPKKITRASIELVDTPGLSRSHEGNPARLAMIREADALVVVVAAFDGSDPKATLASFAEDLVLTDLDMVSRRVEKLRETLAKPRPNQDDQKAELAALEPLVPILESGSALNPAQLTEDQLRATRSFRLLTEKPRLIMINAADDEEDLAQFGSQGPDGEPLLAVRVGLELELEKMAPDERAEFLAEMGLETCDRGQVLRNIMDASGQMLFFTAGDKEVRTWMIRKGGTALDAADGIHTDLARGFIRAEVMQCDDLFRLGSEREVKANNLMRQEPKDYVVQDGDVINIKFSV